MSILVRQISRDETDLQNFFKLCSFSPECRTHFRDFDEGNLMNEHRSSDAREKTNLINALFGEICRRKNQNFSNILPQDIKFAKTNQPKKRTLYCCKW